MKSISVSGYVHKCIMDLKDSDHKSADAVITGLIDENQELKGNIEGLSASIEHYRKLVEEWNAQQQKKED